MRKTLPSFLSCDLIRYKSTERSQFKIIVITNLVLKGSRMLKLALLAVLVNVSLVHCGGWGNTNYWSANWGKKPTLNAWEGKKQFDQKIWNQLDSYVKPYMNKWPDQFKVKSLSMLGFLQEQSTHYYFSRLFAGQI